MRHENKSSAEYGIEKQIEKAKEEVKRLEAALEHERRRPRW